MKGVIPKIVASLSDRDVDAKNIELLSVADIIELRVDLFDDTAYDSITQTFSRARELFNKPILGTLRDPSEGGLRYFQDREEIYKLIGNYCDYIDVELAFGSLITALKGTRTNKELPCLIGSYHNFVETPEEKALQLIIEKGRHLSVDIIKIAVMAKSQGDLLRFLNFADKNRHYNIIAIAMGDEGFPSRIIGGLFGSQMTYGHIGNGVAPGQIHIKELRKLLTGVFCASKGQDVKD